MLNRTLRNTTVGIATATLGLGLAAPAAAAPPRTYHGYYDGVTTYAPGTVGDPACPATEVSVSGTWNVRISADGSTATMSTNLFYDGEHHLAYGGRALDQFRVLPTQSGEEFRIQGDVAGTDNVTVTMTMTTTGELTYVVAPYPPQLFGKDCASLTLTGQEGRPAA